MQVYHFKPHDLAIMNAPSGLIVKADKENILALQSLKTVTNTVNDIYKHTHTVNNDTNDTENTKDVNNHFINIQNGFRIVGNDYKMQNHMNKGYEEFGLMLIWEWKGFPFFKKFISHRSNVIREFTSMLTNLYI